MKEIIVSKNNVNLGFIGDVHFSNLNPTRRLEKDFLEEVVINKLKQILNISIKKNIKAVFILGDLFNKPKIPIEKLNKITDMFYLFKKNNILVFSISGNHDYIRKNTALIKETAFYSLVSTRLITPMKSSSCFVFGNTCVTGVNFFDELIDLPKEVSDKYKNKVILLHKHYENEFLVSDKTENITKEDILKLQYTHYIMGHDHSLHKTIKLENNAQIIRQGSLTRTTCDSYNFNRDIVFTTLEEGVIKYNNLEIKNFKDVVNEIGKTIEKKPESKTIFNLKKTKSNNIEEDIKLIENQKIREKILSYL